MPRRRRPIDSATGPVAEFADLLYRERERAGLTYRELANRALYSHVHLMRADRSDSGKLPGWPLVKGYLHGCGVTGVRLRLWALLWQTIRDDLDGRRAPGIGNRTSSGTSARSSARRQIPRSLRHVDTLRELGEALHEISQRDGPASLRILEARTGVSRSTLAGWFAGRTRPSQVRLEQAAIELGATPDEAQELQAALARISAAAVHTGGTGGTGAEAMTELAVLRTIEELERHASQYDTGRVLELIRALMELVNRQLGLEAEREHLDERRRRRMREYRHNLGVTVDLTAHRPDRPLDPLDPLDRRLQMFVPAVGRTPPIGGRQVDQSGVWDVPKDRRTSA